MKFSKTAFIKKEMSNHLVFFLKMDEHISTAWLRKEPNVSLKGLLIKKLKSHSKISDSFIHDFLGDL